MTPTRDAVDERTVCIRTDAAKVIPWPIRSARARGALHYLIGTASLTSSRWSLTAVVLLGVSGVPLERPLDLRRDGRRRGDVGALHLETVLVRHVRDADLLAVRRYVRVRALRHHRRLVVHLLRLAGLLMADPVARLEATRERNHHVATGNADLSILLATIAIRPRDDFRSFRHGAKLILLPDRVSRCE